MAFRVWLDTDIAFEIACCMVRRTSEDQIFNIKTSTWVRLPEDGRPLPDQVVRMAHYGPMTGPLSGSYYCDWPDKAFVPGAAVQVVHLDGAGTVLSRQATYGLETKIGRITVSLSPNL